MSEKQISRRDFLKTASVSIGGLAIQPFLDFKSLKNKFQLPEFPQGNILGRVLEERIKIKAKPDSESKDVGELYEDDVITILREVVGSRPMWFSQCYYETPRGYIYAPNLQPVKNSTNTAITELSDNEGMWVEVTVPYVDLVIANPPPRSPWLKRALSPRLYYSQIMWVDEIKVDANAQIIYHIKELYGSFGDEFWAPAEAFRIISPEEFKPISPEIEDKVVVVNVTYQTMSCYENGNEVYFARVSTGGKVEYDKTKTKKWATPLGRHTIWRKLASVHMTGGTTGGGYDLPGIGWTTLFSGQGMAIHSTFWHNSYGVPRSHGCVNARPNDAQWVFRWTLPVVPMDTGEITISGKGSTKVVVED